MGRAGQRVVAIAGWGIGGSISLVLCALALYGLVATECVTDGDTRAGRLGVALMVIFAVVVIGAAVAIAVWLRRTVLSDQRFLVGPCFAATLVMLLAMWVPASSLPGVGLDSPAPTAACM